MWRIPRQFFLQILPRIPCWVCLHPSPYCISSSHKLALFAYPLYRVSVGGHVARALVLPFSFYLWSFELISFSGVLPYSGGVGLGGGTPLALSPRKTFFLSLSFHPYFPFFCCCLDLFLFVSRFNSRWPFKSGYSPESLDSMLSPAKTVLAPPVPGSATRGNPFGSANLFHLCCRRLLCDVILCFFFFSFAP